MTGTMKRWGGYLGLAIGLALAGCGKNPPPVTEVEGRVLLNGRPLPKANVVFMPELDKFGAEMNSTGQTDDQGRFRLTCLYKQQPGAVVATHRVVISEIPPSAEFRGQSQEAQAKYADYMRSLKNRPIPDTYSNAPRSPLRVDVKPDQKEYEINLTR